MKKLVLLLTLILMVSPAVSVWSADGDITETEIRADVVKWQIDTFLVHAITKSATVTYRKVDASGNPLGEVSVIFQNVVDDPDTVADETDTSFTDLIVAINAGGNIKTTLKNSVKTKLGL